MVTLLVMEEKRVRAELSIILMVSIGKNSVRKGKKVDAKVTSEIEKCNTIRKTSLKRRRKNRFQRLLRRVFRDYKMGGRNATALTEQASAP
jgi:hypothetical protein